MNPLSQHIKRYKLAYLLCGCLAVSASFDKVVEVYLKMSVEDMRSKAWWNVAAQILDCFRPALLVVIAFLNQELSRAKPEKPTQ